MAADIEPMYLYGQALLAFEPPAEHAARLWQWTRSMREAWAPRHETIRASATKL